VTGICTKRRFYQWEESSVFVLTQIVNASRLPYQLPWYLDLSLISPRSEPSPETRAR
jgi:hypothetical protein